MTEAIFVMALSKKRHKTLLISFLSEAAYAM